MHCCESMKKRINFKCTKHKNKYDCPDAIIEYIPKFDEYGIIIHDGGSSYILINYCPFCGKKLPDSKRELWFKELEKLGFDNPFEQDIPKKYNSERWYK